MLTQIQTAFASAERLFAVLDEESERPDAPDAAVLEHCKGDVAVEHLYFSYDPARKLIEDMNIAAKVEAGLRSLARLGAARRRSSTY